MSTSVAAMATITTSAADSCVHPSKLPVIHIVPDANIRASIVWEKPTATRRPNALHSSKPTWNSRFCDCCCSVASTYCCIVTFCPFTTIASVKESLGGGYERTLLQFGGLALGFIVSVGVAALNYSDKPAEIQVGPAEVHAALQSPQYGGSGSLLMWTVLAAMFLITFLFGVWQLRLQTRQKLGIPGSHASDCLSSFCCCFCVISQLHLQLKYHFDEPPDQQGRRFRTGSSSQTTCSADTLAPYAIM